MGDGSFKRTRYGWPYTIFIWAFGLFSWGLVGFQLGGSFNYYLPLMRQQMLYASIFLLLVVLCVFIRYRPSSENSLPSEDALNLCVVLLFEKEVAISIMGLAAIFNTISQLTSRSRRFKEGNNWQANVGEVFFQGGLLAFVTLTGCTVFDFFAHGKNFTSLQLHDVGSIATTYTAIVLIRWSISFVHSWMRGVPLVEFTREWRELRSWPVLFSEIANVLLAVAMAVVLHWHLSIFILLAGVLVSLVVLLSSQARVTERMESTIVELKVLNTLGRALHNPSQTRKQLLAALYAQSKELFGADSFALYLYPDNQPPGASLHLKFVKEHIAEQNGKLKLGQNGKMAESPALDERLAENAMGMAEWCTRNWRALRVDDVAHQSTDYGYSWLTRQLPFNSWMGVPLESDRRLLGVISVASKNHYAFTEQHQELLRVLGQQVVSALESARLFEMATIDGLTGLLTPRYLRQKLAEEFEKAKKNRQPLGVIMVDIDHFKKINDTYGHEVGNQVLQHLAGVMRSQLRDDDIAARYGGEEFTVLLPGAPTEPTARVSERLRTAIETSIVQTTAGEISITVSIGFASYPKLEVADQTALVASADAALYKSKQGGRNRVTEAVAE